MQAQELQHLSPAPLATLGTAATQALNPKPGGSVAGAKDPVRVKFCCTGTRDGKAQGMAAQH